MTKDEYWNREKRDDQGRLLSRKWTAAHSDIPYRRDGPAIEEFDPATGKTIAMQWFNRARGSRYRDGGKPAFIKIDPETDTVITEEYYFDGFLHNNDSHPARIIRNPSNGMIVKKEFYIDGHLHSDYDLPAVMIFDRLSGMVTRLEYYRQGELHRNNRPAVLEFDQDANVTLEEYYQNGEKIEPHAAAPYTHP